MNTLEILAIIINIVLIWLFIKGLKNYKDWAYDVLMLLICAGAVTLSYFASKYIDILTSPLW